MDYKIEEENFPSSFGQNCPINLVFINQESLIVFIDWNLEKEGIDFKKKWSYFTILILYQMRFIPHPLLIF